MKVLQSIICEGTYNQKPYRSGRLLLASMKKFFVSGMGTGSEVLFRDCYGVTEKNSL